MRKFNNNNDNTGSDHDHDLDHDRIDKLTEDIASNISLLVDAVKAAEHAGSPEAGQAVIMTSLMLIASRGQQALPQTMIGMAMLLADWEDKENE